MSEADFWAKVRRTSPEECWPWTGYVKKSNGHGLTSHKGYPIHASRKAFILTHPEEKRIWDLCVCHRCDNPLCCNPAHLYLGTRADNMIDRWQQTQSEQRGQRGRPTVLTAEQLEQLWQMRRDGMRLRDCAEHFGVHIATVCRYITVVRQAKLQKNREDRLAALAK